MELDQETTAAQRRAIVTAASSALGNGTRMICSLSEPETLTTRTGTVSPQDAQERYQKNPLDPLVLFDGTDDGLGHGVTRMLKDATILITLPFSPNVTLADNPTAKTVTPRRGIPTTRNTPWTAASRIFSRRPSMPYRSITSPPSYRR